MVTRSLISKVLLRASPKPRPKQTLEQTNTLQKANLHAIACFDMKARLLLQAPTIKQNKPLNRPALILTIGASVYNSILSVYKAQLSTVNPQSTCTWKLVPHETSSAPTIRMMATTLKETDDSHVIIEGDTYNQCVDRGVAVI